MRLKKKTRACPHFGDRNWEEDQKKRPAMLFQGVMRRNMGTILTTSNAEIALKLITQ